jgi:ABC-type nitrate/sulfonate/bicarbonate transport system ATPase subunit
MIEISALSFAYDGKPPLFDGLSWSVQRGEAWAVIGPSGCGKTTLLYLIAGLRRPQAGLIRVAGEPLRQPRPATGLILQDFGLLPWETALANVALGLRLRGVPRAEREELAHCWLRRLDLSTVAGQYPAQLSGGQRQRVAIARTLALDPDVLLMDEPFSSLDALTREGLQDLVVDLGIEGALTSVLVTHSIEEAVFLGRRLLVLGKPPLAGATVIENPQAGRLGYRSDPAFHAQCAQVRRLVEDVHYGARR